MSYTVRVVKGREALEQVALSDPSLDTPKVRLDGTMSI